MSNQIVFDSSNWDTIVDTVNKINEIGCMQLGTTSEGEPITFDVSTDEDGEYVLHTATTQSNGWIRNNYYYLADYTVEETYEKDKI